MIAETKKSRRRGSGKNLTRNLRVGMEKRRQKVSEEVVTEKNRK